MLHPTRLGTAQLAPPDAIEHHFPYHDGAFWLGRSIFHDGQPSPDGIALGADDDRHFLLVGGTRGGKGQSIIVPNLCLWPGSVFCVDPKGENAMLTAVPRSEGRNGHPQPVYVLDPFRVARIDNEELRASFNPLWELMQPDPDGEDFGESGDDDYEPAMLPVEHAVDEASIIASAIVVDGDGKGKSDHWNNNARRMIAALILHVITSPRFIGRRNLVTVRRLIMRGADDLAEICRADGKDVESAQALLWNEVACNEAFDGVIKDDGELFAELAKTDPEQFSGVLSTAATHTDFLKSPQIRACLKQSSFRLEELKTAASGISVYLSLPLRFMQTEHYRWMRMLIGLATQQMEKTPGACASGHKVLMMLDEFTSLRRMDYLEEALTQYGSAGLKMFIAVQTLDRLHKVYPDGWQSFISQCGVKFFFNADDNFTREEISKLVGETEISIASTGTQETDTANTSWQVTDTTGGGSSGGKSHAQGVSNSVADQNSWNRSRGGNRGVAINNGEGGGSSHGGGSSEGGGISEGGGRSWGGSTGITREGFTSWLFGASLTGKFSISEQQNWSVQENWQRQRNWQQQTNWQQQSNWQRGRTDNEGQQWNEGTGGGRTISGGTNASDTVQEGWQKSHSHAEGKGGGTAHASGKTVNEQWHRRPLFLPEEVGRFFAGHQDKRDPTYPGFALVIIGGGLSMVIRRVNYHEDYHFVGLFDPHKDYPFVPLPPRPVIAPAPEPKPLALPPVAFSTPRRSWRMIFLRLAALAVVLLLLAAWLAQALHNGMMWVQQLDRSNITASIWITASFIALFVLAAKNLFTEVWWHTFAAAIMIGGIPAVIVTGLLLPALLQIDGAVFGFAQPFLNVLDAHEEAAMMLFWLALVFTLVWLIRRIDFDALADNLSDAWYRLRERFG